MKQTEKQLQRFIAILLSVVLVFSTFEGGSFIGYAAEDTGTANTQTEKEETETVSGRSSPAESASGEETWTSEETTAQTQQSTLEEFATVEEGIQKESSLAQEESSIEENSVEESRIEENSTEESSLEESSLENDTLEEFTTESEERTEEELTTEELLINDENTQSSEIYTGTIETYENDWRELCIRENEFEDFYSSQSEEEKSFDDAAIIEILTAHETDTDKFDSVTIQYSASNEMISQSLWKAAAEFEGKKDNYYICFQYYGETFDFNWFFENPNSTDTDVNIAVTKLEIQQNADDGIKVMLANTDFPTESVRLNICTDTSRADGEQYQALTAIFGETNIQLAVYEADSQLDNMAGGYWTYSRENENVKEAGFGFQDVKNLQKDIEYTLRKAIYKGETWTSEEDGRTGLDISYLGAEKQEALTIEEIEEILNTYYKDQTFDEIYLEQPTGSSNIILKDIANMFYSYLNIESGDCRLRFGFIGENGACTEWKLWNPEPSQDSDQNVLAAMTVTDSKISVTIQKKPQFKAEKTELCFSRNKEQDNATVENIIKILGENEGEIVFRGNDDSEIGGWYGSDEWNVRFDTNAVNEMTEGTEYTVERYSYKGDTWEWTDEDGTGHIGLNINYGSAEVEELNLETIQEILSRREGETFDEIYLEQPFKSDGNVISKAVANELYQHLKEPAEGTQYRVRFGFVNDSNGSGMEWRLVNPAAVQEKDQTVFAELKISTDNKAVIKVGAQSFQSEDVELAFFRNNQRDGETVSKLKELFGENDCELVFCCENQAETYGDFHSDQNEEEPDNYNVIINVHHVNELAVDKEYIVEKSVYKGEVYEQDGRLELNISYRSAGKEEALTPQEIKEILAYHTDAKFDEIYIEQPTQGDKNVISKEVANATYNYLKEQVEGAECRLKFAFIDSEKEASIEWRLINPSAEQKGDQTASAELKVIDDTIIVKVLERPEFEAERTEVGFSKNAEREGAIVETIKSVLGSEEGGIVFADDTGKETDGYFGFDEWNLWLGVNSVEELEIGKEYKAGIRVYKGDTYTWTNDGEGGKEHIGLNISYRGAGKEDALAVEEIQQILSYRDSETFDEIYLEQPFESDNNVILKTVADTLYRYLKPRADEEERRLKFSFFNAATESRLEWVLLNPEQEQEGDQTVTAIMDISDGKVNLSISNQIWKAESIALGIGKEITKDPDSAALIKLFGESDCDLIFWTEQEQNAYGHYRVEQDNNLLWIELENIGTIKADKIYSVEKDRYLGTVSEKYILISSFNRFYQQDQFTTEQLEEIVAFYESQERSFDTVLIQQKYTDNNMIHKELYNIAMRILSDSPNRRLSFSFCSCQSTDKDHRPLNWEKQEWNHANQSMQFSEFGYYYLQDDVIWSFVNPSAGEKDINANITLKMEKNKGVTIQLADNCPYNAEDVSIKYYCDPQTDIGRELEAALGKPEDFGGEKSKDLFVLDKETNTPDHCVEACYMTNEAWEDGYGNPPYDQNYSLYLNNVQEWIPDKEFWLTKIEYLTETAEGEKFQLPTLPEGAQNAVWQSFNTDIAVIEGDKLKQVDTNEGYVHFSVTYSLDGEEYQKVYRVYMAEKVIPITKIQFNRKNLTMEVPPKGADWESLEYLEVKYYPANATIDMDQSNLKWTTSDNKVVTLIRNSNGKCEGEIKAVGAGKATIRAEYKEGIYAECVVTVEESVVIEEGKWPEPYAVTNFDKTLSDVVLPKDDSGEWKWKEPSTSLAPYVGMEWHAFAAVYTRKSDEKTMDAMIGVRMTAITGAEIISAEDTDIPAAMTRDTNILLDADLYVDNGDYIEDIAQNPKYNQKLEIHWSASPSEALSAAEENGKKIQRFTANGSAGKKNVTVSVVDTQTNKILVKDSITINVTNSPTMNFKEMKVTVDGVLQDNNQWIRLDKDTKAAGVIAFSTDQEDNKNYTITAKSSDTSVLQIKPDGSNRFAYTIKNYGKAQLTVTANDEIKSSWNIEVSILDKMPQIVQSQVTINKADKNKSALLTVVYAEGYKADGTDAVTVDGSDFTYEDGRLILQNTNLKGTASAKVNVKCIREDGTDRFTAEKTVKVKLVDKLPKVTWKQTKKVNAFYKNTADNHAGILTVSAGSALVSIVRINPSTDFEILSTEEKDVYRIIIKDNREILTPSKVTVQYTITDSTGTEFEAEKELKIAVENKAPTLVLSAKTDTLYPKAGFDDSVLTLSEKETGRPIEPISIKYNNEEITKPISLNKNLYDIELDENAKIRFKLHDRYCTKGTDKITLGVESSEWTKPVNISYKLKVDINEPKLKLSSSKLTINKNEDFGIYQSIELTLSLAGRATPFDGYVTFEGPANILNQVIVLDDRGEGRIGVRLNASKEDLRTVSEGSYQFTVRADKGDWAGALTTFKVDIKDFAKEKCIKVSKKGSIDVLRRNQTYITYTPKVSNLAGRVIDGWITGIDAGLFDAEYDMEKGQLCIRAKQNGIEEVWSYSTKGSYKITPVFVMETTDGYRYEIMAAQQTVKVTQGKPKITALSEYGNTLYREAGRGELTFGIAAELSNQKIAIEDVTLVNYKKDLNIAYDRETCMVTLNQTAMSEITKSGKLWKVKLAVRYADKAGNEKDIIVTYKVVIK